MNIKTISQLTLLNSDINNSSYFGIAQYLGAGNTTYGSRKVTYQKLRDQLSAYVDSNVLGGLYNAKNSSGRINVSQLRTDVNNLQSGSVTIGGVKTFSAVPRVNTTVGTSDGKAVPNIDCVKSLITSNAGFMANGQHLDVDPLNGTGYTYFDGADPDPKQMYWHIDHGQRDSSMWIDELGARAGAVTCKYTGNLVCYGWLADNGNVRPESAWVGMFGKVKCGSNPNPSWVALQIQPWIVGKYSSTLQYVGFNLPVRYGLELKIMTGFAVNGNNTGLTDRPTLMFADAGNMPNTFVGYILRS